MVGSVTVLHDFWSFFNDLLLLGSVNVAIKVRYWSLTSLNITRMISDKTLSSYM